jgi:hypothetical protein
MRRFEIYFITRVNYGKWSIRWLIHLFPFNTVYLPVKNHFYVFFIHFKRMVYETMYKILRKFDSSPNINIMFKIKRF